MDSNILHARNYDTNIVSDIGKQLTSQIESNLGQGLANALQAASSKAYDAVITNYTNEQAKLQGISESAVNVPAEVVKKAEEAARQALDNFDVAGFSQGLGSNISELTQKLYDEAFGNTSKRISGFLTSNTSEAEKFTTGFIESMRRLFDAIDENGGQLTDNNLLKIARAMVQATQLTEETYGRLTRSMTQQAD